MRRYVIRRGDTLTKLAFLHELDADRVWNDEANRELRERRSHPDILLPGDVLAIPERSPRHQAIAPGETRRIRAHVPSVEVRIALRDEDGRPRAGVAYRVEGLTAEPIPGHADASGVAILRVPVHVEEVRLVVDGAPRALRVRVGHLDPVEEPSGVRQRLTHLGYLRWRDALEDTAEGHARIARAIGALQRDAGLTVTGEIDAPTRAALEQRHGS